jgi:hypothetical protein
MAKMSTQRKRSRVYDVGVPDEQGDFMRAEPYLTHDLNWDNDIAAHAETTSATQRGQHGEGAETIGNSVRGAFSGGLSGATTTRGGQQGGIGASVYDPEPTVDDDEHAGNVTSTLERDLTLSERYGGVMAAPGGPINSGPTSDELGDLTAPEPDTAAKDEWRRGDT